MSNPVKLGVRKNSSRNSSIELLKIMAMFLIVIFHTNMSLENSHIIPPMYFGSSNVLEPSNYFLQMVNYFGGIGNIIFWVCSVWFLVSDNRMSCRKIFSVVADIWVISMLIFIPSVGYLGLKTLAHYIIPCAFPTFFANNWYMTCYLLVFAIHPLLNLIINSFDKLSYFRFTLAIGLLYCVSSMLYTGMFFSSNLIIFIVIYFIVGYIKLYGAKFSLDRKINLTVLIISIASLCAYNYLFDYLKVFYGIESKHFLFWIGIENPFIILIAITLFNLVRNYNFHSKLVNYISSLTLFIYIIHENVIVRGFYRISIWEWIAERFGTSHIIVELLIYSLLLFVVAVVLSIIYKEIIKRTLTGIIEKTYSMLANFYKKLERIMIGE